MTRHDCSSSIVRVASPPAGGWAQVTAEIADGTRPDMVMLLELRMVETCLVL